MKTSGCGTDILREAETEACRAEDIFDVRFSIAVVAGRRGSTCDQGAGATHSTLSRAGRRGSILPRQPPLLGGTPWSGADLWLSGRPVPRRPDPIWPGRSQLLDLQPFVE